MCSDSVYPKYNDFLLASTLYINAIASKDIIYSFYVTLIAIEVCKHQRVAKLSEVRKQKLMSSSMTKFHFSECLKQNNFVAASNYYRKGQKVQGDFLSASKNLFPEELTGDVDFPS